MGIVTWLDGASRLLTSQAAPNSRLPLPPKQFQYAAMCERMRVDRNGSVLAVLTIELSPQNSSSKDEARLAKLLETRLRLTDTVGRLDGGRFGVLLPDTPESGAWKVATDVCSHYEPGNTRPRCEVLVYPGSDDDEGKPSAPVDDSDPGVPVGAGDRGESFFALRTSPWKRLVDIVGASVGLLVSLPLMVVAAIAIKCTSKGSVFFLQEREGLGGKRFMMCKLRTMRADADRLQDELRRYSEQDGPAFKMTDDPRITRVGRFLRQSSLDEIPQLWNVLRGDMSLVGPRPLPTLESLQCAPWQRQRLQVVPGLTCIWQIRGRSVVSFDEWIRMDLTYIHRRSVWYDLLLILQTLPAIATTKGPR